MGLCRPCPLCFHRQSWGNPFARSWQLKFRVKIVQTLCSKDSARYICFYYINLNQYMYIQLVGIHAHLPVRSLAENRADKTSHPLIPKGLHAFNTLLHALKHPQDWHVLVRLEGNHTDNANFSVYLVDLSSKAGIWLRCLTKQHLTR